MFILCMQIMGKPQTSGAYVLNKVPVKHRLGHASGNQSDASHLLNQSGGAGEDCQVCELHIYFCEFHVYLESFSDTKRKYTNWKLLVIAKNPKCLNKLIII